MYDPSVPVEPVRSTTRPPFPLPLSLARFTDLFISTPKNPAEYFWIIASIAWICESRTDSEAPSAHAIKAITFRASEWIVGFSKMMF